MTIRTVGVVYRLAARSVTCDNAQLSEPCSRWPAAASVGSGHQLAIIMLCCDITAGHYYGQLMTTAHANCHWPAAAWFTEHGQQARHRRLLGSHSHCPANDNVTVCLNKVSSG